MYRKQPVSCTRNNLQPYTSQPAKSLTRTTACTDFNLYCCIIVLLAFKSINCTIYSATLAPE